MPDSFNSAYLATMQLFEFNNVATGENFGLSALEKDGQIWFVAADVCRALDLDSTAVRRLDEDERNTLRIAQPNRRGNPNLGIISESGLYALIFTSRKASAKVFRKWITSTVIPSIRTHGGYINGQEALPAEQRAETLQVVQQEAQRVGLCVAEEKEARSGALRHMGKGRRRRKGPRMKPLEDTRHGY